MQLISNKYKTFIINRLAEISGLIFLSFSILLFFILFSYSPLDPSINNVTDQEAQNILGTIGANIADLLMQIFGSTSYLLLIIFLAWSYRLIKFKKLPFFVINLFCSLICLFIIDILFLIYETNIIHGFISKEVFINFIEPLYLSQKNKLAKKLYNNILSEINSRINTIISAKEESNSEYLDDLFDEELSSAKNLLQIIQDYESEKFIESESEKINDKKIEFMSK